MIIHDTGTVIPWLLDVAGDATVQLPLQDIVFLMQAVR